jgi:CRISPR system Cascade subunit CasE
MADAPDRTRDFLWREDGHGAFLILAPRPALANGGLFDVEHKSWAPELREGDRLGFTLRANPTISQRIAGQRGKRQDVVMHAIHALPRSERAGARASAIVAVGSDWLSRQGEVHGYTLEATTLNVDGYDTIEIARTGDPAKFGRMEFDGVLTVTDPDRFIKAVSQGFGRARAFGCGLMLLRRA